MPGKTYDISIDSKLNNLLGLNQILGFCKTRAKYMSCITLGIFKEHLHKKMKSGNNFLIKTHKFRMTSCDAGQGFRDEGAKIFQSEKKLARNVFGI